MTFSPMCDLTGVDDACLPNWIVCDGSDFWLDGVSAAALAQRLGTPLFAYSSSRLSQNANALQDAFAGTCKLMVSYKACTQAEILRRLHSHGIGAEVCSVFELGLARRAGVPPGRIAWNAVALTEAEAAQAVAEPLLWLGLGALDDVTRVANAAAAAGRTVDVMLRVHPVVQQDGYVARGSRLGFDVADGSAAGAVAAVAAEPNLRLVGLHYHVDIGQTDGHSAAETLRRLLRYCQTQLGQAADWLQRICLGGGLASASEFAQAPGSLERYSHALADARRSWPGPLTLYLEPGRYFTSDAAVVLSRCLSAFRNAGADWRVVDATTNSLVPFEGRRFPIAGLLTGPDPVLVGDRMSTSTGIIGSTRAQVTPGDLLLILEAGAYTVSTSQEFMFGGPGVVLLDEGAAWPLRERESVPAWIGRVGGTILPSAEEFFDAWQELQLSETPETLMLGGHVVMHRWETPLLQAFARELDVSDQEVLEIGFGMGLSASAFQARSPCKHVIYEPHPQIRARADAWRLQQDHPERIDLRAGLWQSIDPAQNERFDVVFFDGYSEPGSEFSDAAQFAALASTMLRPGGKFGFFCMEPALSTETQLMLLQHFDRLEFAAVRGLAPSADFAALGVGDTMIVPVAMGPRRGAPA